VAAEGSARGRRLFAGTVNLDSGKLVIWDLTRVAAARRYDLYRQVVLASASVPVLYPPTEINGALHVDGGARALLFFRTYLLPTVVTTHRARRPPPPATGPATAPTTAPASPRPAVYVIVNGKVGLDPHCTNDGLLPIALRSIECLVDAVGVANLFQTKLFARELEYDFFVSYIPDDVPSLASDQFVPKDMTRLFEQGARRGRDVEFFDVPNVDELREGRGM
jgi:hypothetical protein